MTPELKNLLELTVLVAAALGGAAAIWRLVWVPIIKASLKVKGFFKKVCDGLDKIDKIDARVIELEKQTRINGGSSLKDDLNLIKERLGYIENLVSAQMEDDAAAVFVCNSSAENSYINRTYCRLLGVSKNELEGQGWKNFISSSVGGKYDVIWQDAFLHNREVSTDVSMQRADGKTICCHLVITPLNKSGDKTRRFLGRIKLNPKCTEDKCKLGDICPHRPASRAD